ncbi:MAG: ornithine carbamoyltransferase [Desulfobacterales bacterium]|nr:ornithine carbamoyltransferase [Desulfobacterales bacterium]
MATHLLNLWDCTAEELNAYIRRALELKQEARAGTSHRQLAGRIVALVFEKPSTRTRVSFEAAMYGLGGQVIFMADKDTQISRGEPLKDMARVLARYVDGMVVRTYGQEVVEELARFSTVPVINALTDLHHPCQILSDIMTVIENKGDIEKLHVAWVGDGNNMANSWIQAAGRMGFSLTLACPEGYDPDPDILLQAREQAPRPISLIRDPAGAVRGADVINTDVWASMGQEDEQQVRARIFRPFQVNQELLGQGNADAIVLHCLPAHRGEEITDAVLEGKQCVAFDQAENKLHIHKAILERHLLGK